MKTLPIARGMLLGARLRQWSKRVFVVDSVDGKAKLYATRRVDVKEFLVARRAGRLRRLGEDDVRDMEYYEVLS